MTEKRVLPLRRERERRGWSRMYIAEQIEVDIITVGRWERGERMPHPQFRQKLCTLFEMTAQDLGLVAEYHQQVDDAEKALQKPVETLPDAITTVDIPTTLKNPDTDAIPPESHKKVEAARQNASILSHHRRSLLFGLGGLGIAALGATSVALFLRYNPSSPPAPQKPLHQYLDPNSPVNWINRIVWSPDNNAIAVANGENLVTIWNMQRGMIINYYPTSNLWVNDIFWSRTNWIGAATAEHNAGSIHLWKFPQKTPVYTLKRNYAMRTAALSPDEHYLAIAGHAQIVEVLDLLTKRLIYTYPYPALGDLGIMRVRWSPDGNFLACATDDGTAHVWDASTGKPRRIYQEHQQGLLDLAWSPNGEYIASGGIDQTIRVWEALSGRTVRTYSAHTAKINGLCWSPDTTAIASGDQGQTVHVWQAFTGKQITTYKRTSPIQSVSWSQDGKIIAVGMEAEGFEIWQSPGS